MRSRLFLSSLLVLALLAASPSVFAQRGRRGPTPPEAGAERAKKAYSEGAAAYQLGNFAEAARKFEESYRISKFPTILFDIAQSYRRLYEANRDLENLKKAFDLYQAFLREAPPEAAKRPVALKLLPQLEKTIASDMQRRRESLVARARGREGLRLAEQLLAEGAEKDALLVLDRVLASQGNPRDVIVAALQKKGLVAGKLGKKEDASQAFERLLALDPGFLLPDGMDKTTTAAYETAREFWQGKRPLAVTHTPSGAVERNQPARIAVTVESDPLKMVAHIAVFYRLAGGGAYSATRSGADAGAVEIPSSFLAGLPGGTRVEYYVAALDQFGGELATVGTPEEPLVLLVPPEPTVAGPGGAQPTGTPWYKKWWVWTIVGSVAAGAGAGVYFGTRSSPFNPTPIHLDTRTP